MDKSKIQMEEEYVREIVKEITVLVLEEFTFQEQTWGVDHAQKIYSSVIASIISAVVYKSMADIPDSITVDQERYEWVAESYMQTKVVMQNSVAAAFKNAMLTYSGKESDYYCLVKMVPEAVNKPC